jgi:HAD superfamily hydrolase (TIGR01457 family)
VDGRFFNGHDVLLCDLDGVVYAGEHAIEGAVETLRELDALGVPVAYVTNNASRSPESVAEHLNSFGLSVDGEQVFGSATAGVALLDDELGGRTARVLVVGSDYLRGLVAGAGHEVVESAAEHPEAVIQGFDPMVGWKDLAQAAFAVRSGARWVATNTDLTIPRAEGIAPGNGALVEAVSRATGSVPVAAGKPEPVLFRMAAERLGGRRPLVVGDRLDTDVLGGNRAGFDTVLVLTGVDDRRTTRAASPDQQPTWILEDLPALLQAVPDRWDGRTGTDR